MRRGIRGKLSEIISSLRGDQTEPLALMRAIWDRIRRDVVAIGGGRSDIPYARVKVSIFAEDEARVRVFKARLEESRKLEKFLREKLKDEACVTAGKFRVGVGFVYERPAAWGSDIFSVAPESDGACSKGAPAQLLVLKGTARRKRYKVEKRRTYIGRLKEVKDAGGRTVRLNDVVFEDTGDKINTSVGRLHACIDFDESEESFTLQDTGGETGTHIERGGHLIEVQVNQRVRLRDEDNIHLGRALLQIRLASKDTAR